MMSALPQTVRSYARISDSIWRCDIYGGLIAQKYIDEIIRPHVESHIDNHACVGREICLYTRKPRIQVLISLQTYGGLCPDTSMV